jgi:hypothetical protein
LDAPTSQSGFAPKCELFFQPSRLLPSSPLFLQPQHSPLLNSQSHAAADLPKYVLPRNPLERNPLDLLLYILTHCLRIVPLDFAPTAIRKAERKGLVTRRKVFARPPLMLNGPLAVIGPKDELPDGWEHKLQWIAEKRLEEPRQYDVYFASQFGCNVFGGSVPKVNDLQVGHDVLLAQVFSEYMHRGLRPELWTGEDQMEGCFESITNKVPDAFILGSPCKVIEILGFYSANRIREFVLEFKNGLITVELW